MHMIFRKPFAFMKTLGCFLFVKEDTLDNQCFSSWDKHSMNKFIFFLRYTNTFFTYWSFQRKNLLMRPWMSQQHLSG